jgi:hypothetical protein
MNRSPLSFERLFARFVAAARAIMTSDAEYSKRESYAYDEGRALRVVPTSSFVPVAVR